MFSSRFTYTAAVFALLAAPAIAAEEQDLGKKVWISPITAHTWRVRSISPLGDFGDVESNAVLAAGPRESVLIDTPATIEQTAVVLDWAEKKLKLPVRHLICTHWHDDRMGGIAAAVLRGIATYSDERTVGLAKKAGLIPPAHVLRSGEPLTLAGVTLEPFYPGHGHTVDNIVVWLPDENVLDGGCFIKAANAKSLGNTAEINVPEWRKAAGLVANRYAGATIVVPGHGALGGLELLAHTRDLLRASSGCSLP